MTKAGNATRLNLAAVAISCMMFAATASADQMSLTLSSSYPTGYAFYSYTATDGSAQNNVPVFPYPVSLSDTNGLYKNATSYAICYDINNPSNVGQVYTGHFANNTDFASMEATYLANQLNLAGLYSAPTSLKGAISMAIGELMFPSSTKTGGSSVSAGSLPTPLSSRHP